MDPEQVNLIVDTNAQLNQATLSGTVPTEVLKTRAVLLAKEAQPGLAVKDDIEVKAAEVSRSDFTLEMAQTERQKAKSVGENVGRTIDDAWIHAKVTAKLVANLGSSARKIEVDVQNNDVTLRGMVNSELAKMQAKILRSKWRVWKHCAPRRVRKAGEFLLSSLNCVAWPFGPSVANNLTGAFWRPTETNREGNYSHDDARNVRNSVRTTI